MAHDVVQELDRQSSKFASELQYALDRERAAAEERGKATVMVQAERDKGILQEQIAFLKAQLQFALKVTV